MGLSLQEANASIELSCYGLILVVLWEGANEGGVVRSNLGDIGVLSGVESGIAVASCLCENERKETDQQRKRKQDIRMHAR